MSPDGLDAAKISEVDWAQLEDAYGPATGIPELLEALTHEDAKARKKALADLDNRIAHQGFATEAAVAVVPFLIDLLEADHPDQEALLVLLADLSVGGSHLHAICQHRHHLLADHHLPPLS